MFLFVCLCVCLHGLFHFSYCKLSSMHFIYLFAIERIQHDQMLGYFRRIFHRFYSILQEAFPDSWDYLVVRLVTLPFFLIENQVWIRSSLMMFNVKIFLLTAKVCRDSKKWLGKSILLRDTKTYSYQSDMWYVEDSIIWGVKILLNGDWRSSLDRRLPRQLLPQ